MIPATSWCCDLFAIAKIPWVERCVMIGMIAEIYALYSLKCRLIGKIRLCTYDCLGQVIALTINPSL